MRTAKPPERIRLQFGRLCYEDCIKFWKHWKQPSPGVNESVSRPWETPTCLQSTYTYKEVSIETKGLRDR